MFDDYVSDRQYSINKKSGNRIFPGGRLAAMASQQAMINQGVNSGMIPPTLPVGSAIAYNAFDTWKKNKQNRGIQPTAIDGIF